MVVRGDKVRIIKSLRPLGVTGGDKYIDCIGTVEFVSEDNSSICVRFGSFDKWWMSPDYFVSLAPLNLERIW